MYNDVTLYLMTIREKQNPLLSTRACLLASIIHLAHTVTVRSSSSAHASATYHRVTVLIMFHHKHIMNTSTNIS